MASRHGTEFLREAVRLALTSGLIPDHSTGSWLAMMFCSGIGVGILVFSISEPISHLVTNPDIIFGVVTAQSYEGVPTSFRFLFLHWGFSAWACYALIGMRLGWPAIVRANP